MRLAFLFFIYGLCAVDISVASAAVVIADPTGMRFSAWKFPARRFLLMSAPDSERKKLFRSSIRKISTHRSLLNGRNARIQNEGEKFGRICEESTRLWVQHFVFGRGMCPWSGSSLIGDRMKVRMVPLGCSNKMSMIKLTEVILQECGSLKAESEKEGGGSMATTLLVLPEFKEFEDFLDIVAIAEGLLEETKLDEFVQLAHFHPKYLFEGSTDDSVENYTNRSPFPTLHLIQVAEVSKAIAACKDGDTIFVWKNNIETVRKLGKEKLDDILRHILDEAEKKIES